MPKPRKPLKETDPEFNKLATSSPSQIAADERRAKAHDILFEKGLAQEVDSMQARQAEFVYDMLERFDKYGATTYVSEGQLDWLERLEGVYL